MSLSSHATKDKSMVIKRSLEGKQESRCSAVTFPPLYRARISFPSLYPNLPIIGVNVKLTQDQCLGATSPSTIVTHLSHVFLDQLWADDPDEAGIGAVGYGSGTQGFTCPGWAEQQNPLRGLNSQVDKPLGLKAERTTRGDISRGTKDPICFKCTRCLITLPQMQEIWGHSPMFLLPYLLIPSHLNVTNV